MKIKFAITIISSLFLVECQSRLPDYSIYRTFEEGARFILSCTFNRLVQCSWRINDEYLSSPDLYTYVNPDESLPNNICTIEISSFNSTAHSGYWDCVEFNAPSRQIRVSYHLNKPYMIRKIIGINTDDRYLWTIISIFAFMVILVTVTLAISVYFKVNNKQEKDNLKQRLYRETDDQELAIISETLIYE